MSCHALNVLFTERDKLAIEAGLESMRVRLGSGFVSQNNLDKKIQKLVATNGPWARKMLNRTCFVAESIKYSPHVTACHSFMHVQGRKHFVDATHCRGTRS